MNQFVTDNWPLLLVGAALTLVILWWLIAASRRTRVAVDRRDTLDEGAAPAQRNQALIDAPPAVTRAPAASPAAERATPPAPSPALTAAPPPAVPEALGGAGIAVAAAAQDARLDARDAAGDDLTRIKGLGPKLAATLAELGVTRFDQIAGWSDADVERIDAQLGRFQGRIRRDDWIGQAKFLAAGDTAGFEERFGAA